MIRPDPVTVVMPMYNEERGAAAALSSVFGQRRRADRIVVSINGGRDDTEAVVAGTLEAEGYVPGRCTAAAPTTSSAGRTRLPRVTDWLPAHGIGPSVTVLAYDEQIGKAESINAVVARDAASRTRYVVMDGDTILDPGFLEALGRHFVRLRRRRTPLGGEPRWEIEDVGLQSGAVTSYARPADPAAKRWISDARKAEYAFSSVVRQGQTRRFGRHAATSRSRLYTVIGCGFAARSDLFPVPERSKTEDHDFTLQAQNVDARRERTTAATLAQRGYRVRLGGRDVPLDRLLAPEEPVEIVTTGNARFAIDAQMHTEDPPHPNGLVRQLERWHGGGQQNVLQRLGVRLRANVAIAMWAALLESLIGLFLLVALPLGVALRIGNPSLGIDPRWIPVSLGADLVLTTAVVAIGFVRFRRGTGSTWVAALLRGSRDALATALPFALVRLVSPFTYLAAARVELRDHVRGRAARRQRHRTGDAADAWQRPATRSRTLTVPMLPALTGVLLVAVGLAHSVAPLVNPINAEAWRLTHARQPVEIVEPDVATRPVRHIVADPAPQRQSDERFAAVPVLDARSAERPLSTYCSAEAVPHARTVARILRTDRGAAEPIRGPLGLGQLLLLARLAPIAAYVEEASEAYGVPANHLLRVLINESYLDPLAEGPTADFGLAQVTGDALTLLRGVSVDPSSAFANPHLLAGPINVFDPDFSICAGAAKLAWSRAQPGVDDDHEAYAVYINPVRGLRHGELHGEYLSLTAPMDALLPIADALLDRLDRYADDPSSLPPAERDLAHVASDVRDGRIDLAEAYRRTWTLVERYGIPDAPMYERVLAEFYGVPVAAIDAAVR